MVYEISYQTERDAQDPHSEFRHSFFVESESEPNREKVRRAMEKFSRGDFALGTIQIEAHPDIDAAGLKKDTQILRLD